MVIEWQRVRVQPEMRDLFLDKDGEIWTAGLARGEAGFLGKEVWLGENPEGIGGIDDHPGIRWQREDDGKEMPEERLADLEIAASARRCPIYEVMESRSSEPVGPYAVA